MSINRYNYEEFFLLYADGELSPLEVEMVNQFVQFHPDLKEELEILMDCKLVADIPVFFPKEKLYKQTIWDAENINDTQAQLLLLLDNELVGKEKETLEKSIEENSVLQHEWNVLQQAKLPVETIVHPYKKPLYKEKKIPVLGWLRWAAAAAIVGAGLFLLGKNVGENKVIAPQVLAKNIDLKQPKAATIIQPIAPENTTEDDQSTNESVITSTDNTVRQNNGNEIAQGDPDEKSSSNKIVTANKEKPEEDHSTDVAQNVVVNDNIVVDDNDTRTSLITNRATDNVEDIKAKPTVVRLKAPKVGSIASTISNKSSQNMADLQSDADDDEYVRIAGARVKKQKIRGVFRGVFRGLGRTFSNSKVEPAVALNNE